MALVSKEGSSLNPDAPPFVPAAYRDVEDFSPEWWQLVTTTSWFRQYWLNQRETTDPKPEEYEEDIMDLLPDFFEIDGFPAESQFPDLQDNNETVADPNTPTTSTPLPSSDRPIYT